MEQRPPVALVRRARAVDRILQKTYPDAHCELDFRNPYELLVATILSAQCTDQRVNQVTPALFAKYPDPAALAAADRQELEAPRSRREPRRPRRARATTAARARSARRPAAHPLFKVVPGPVQDGARP